MAEGKGEGLSGGKGPPKVYDGTRVVAHPIQPGENLSKIAAIYQMRHPPIFRYNTQVEQTLEKDPNLIKPGVTIFIPRSERAYRARIIQMKKAALDADHLADRLLYELESREFELQAYKVVLNLAGDIATSMATLGMKVVGAIKATTVANATKGQAKIAQRLFANASTQEFAEAYAAIRGKRLTAALANHRTATAARQAVRHEIGAKAIGTGAAVADSLSGDDEWFSDAFKIGKGLLGLRDAKSVGEAFGTITETALDFLTPSGFAEMWLLAFSGETTATSADNARRMIETSRASALAGIEAQIERLKTEQLQVYPK